MSTLEKQDLSFRFLCRDVLGGNQICESEENHQSNDNSKIPNKVSSVVCQCLSVLHFLPPQMTWVIIKTQPNVVVAGNGAQSRNSSNNSTDMVESAHVKVLRTHRDKSGTVKIAILELINHQTLEGIGNGIDVVNPAEPRMHVMNRNHKSSISHQSKDEHC
jgi:hypothetical protein